MKVEGHSVQAKGLCPVWVNMCRAVEFRAVNSLEQTGHAHFCPPSLIGSFCNYQKEREQA